MPPLKAIEQAEFGGVDSRSNPVNMPMKRFLRCRNWIPRPDGHLELRDGYKKQITAQLPLAGPAYSLCPYQMAVPGTEATYPDGAGGFPNGIKCALWWQVTGPSPAAQPFLQRLDTGIVVSPDIDGLPIASAARWHYALGKDGFLYMHNGTDAKFFDGVKFRDIGLPPLNATDQLPPISVLEGFGAPSNAEVSAATVTPSSVGGSSLPVGSYQLFYAFFDLSTNALAPCTTPLTGGFVTIPSPDNTLTIDHLPTDTDSNIVGLLSYNYQAPTLGFAPGASFFTVGAENPSDPDAFGEDGTLAPTTGTTVRVTVSSPPTTFAVDDVIVIDNAGGDAWPSSGPFAVTAVAGGGTWFEFQAASDAAALLYTGSGHFVKLLVVPNLVSGPITIVQGDKVANQGTAHSSTGLLQLEYTDLIQTQLLPASAIGGTQPGYQFYASIYNPITGHVGNRTPIGPRLNNASDCEVIISSLPNLTTMSMLSATKAKVQVRYGYGSRNTLWGAKSGSDPIALPETNSEWRLLIGRTEDGGEVPYACIDADGNWITTTSEAQTTITIASAAIDGNSELPVNNYPPPAFANFWREGDRLCGTIINTDSGLVQYQPFVYRSASEVDATTGIFVGDPAQAWDPSRLETFPTAEGIRGGFGNMQESWTFTDNDCAVLSELSGEVVWNGPWNFGIAGPFAFDRGWKSLPFWVSHDRQLCTMLPGSDGPIPISTEYETALLFKIGEDFDAVGNAQGYKSRTEVTYFRDPARMIDVLRIHCVDADGVPFTIIHDFNLRDDASPYGQGYEEIYLGELAIDYQQAFMRDLNGHQRVWAAAENGAIYQFYTGGLDDADILGAGGEAYTADAINLRYIGGEHTAVRTLEWYGDDKILWYISENMLNVLTDPVYWVNLTFEMRPVPGDAHNAHWMADLQRPEMTHCYLWAQLQAHPQDLPDVPVPPTGNTEKDPMALSPWPHIPLETYGRLYMAAPILADSRGR